MKSLWRYRRVLPDAGTLGEGRTPVVRLGKSFPLKDDRLIREDEKVLLYNTGTALKHFDSTG